MLVLQTSLQDFPDFHAHCLQISVDQENKNLSRVQTDSLLLSGWANNEKKFALSGWYWCKAGLAQML